MVRPLIVIAAFLALAVPTALAAPPVDKGKPEKNKQEQQQPGAQAPEDNAAQACKAERGTSSESMAAFKVKYGSTGLGKCIAGEKAEAEQAEAEKNAAKACKAERGTSPASIAAFRLKYGTNHNKKNAFGKCVSKLAKESEVLEPDA
jgi:hypothetical protein